MVIVSTQSRLLICVGMRASIVPNCAVERGVCMLQCGVLQLGEVQRSQALRPLGLCEAATSNVPIGTTKVHNQRLVQPCVRLNLQPKETSAHMPSPMSTTHMLLHSFGV